MNIDRVLAQKAEDELNLWNYRIKKVKEAHQLKHDLLPFVLKVSWDEIKSETERVMLLYNWAGLNCSPYNVLEIDLNESLWNVCLLYEWRHDVFRDWTIMSLQKLSNKNHSHHETSLVLYHEKYIQFVLAREADQRIMSCFSLDFLPSDLISMIWQLCIDKYPYPAKFIHHQSWDLPDQMEVIREKMFYPKIENASIIHMLKFL
jgi:hypothetical protein